MVGTNSPFDRSGWVAGSALPSSKVWSHRAGDAAKQGFLHRVSIVVPVYRGATTLPDLMREIEALTKNSLTPRGHDFIVFEVLLVYDHGPDSSAEVMRSLERQYDFVRTLWLSRNYGGRRCHPGGHRLDGR